jgi:hypothetical protein
MVAPNARSSVWLSFDGRNRQELMQGDWYNQFKYLHIHRNLSKTNPVQNGILYKPNHLNKTESCINKALNKALDWT